MELSQDHIQRVNIALHYIEQHLESDLSLEQISKIAHYSPYHFHRLFRTFIGETLNHYIARKRVEKASADLLHREHLTISELSTRYGFTSHSSFTRAFKKFYGISPSDFRRKSKGKYSKISQTKSKNGQAITTFETYVCHHNQNNDSVMTTNIEVKTIKAIHTVGITCIGKAQMASTFNRLLNWAGSQGLLRQADFKMGTIFYDSFKITTPDKVRMCAFLPIEGPITTNGAIISTTLNSGLYIKAHYTLSIDEFPTTWMRLFKWMNDNGYKKRNEPPFEIYHNDFNTHPEKKCIVDMYIPVV